MQYPERGGAETFKLGVSCMAGPARANKTTFTNTILSSLALCVSSLQPVCIYFLRKRSRAAAIYASFEIFRSCHFHAWNCRYQVSYHSSSENTHPKYRECIFFFFFKFSVILVFFQCRIAGTCFTVRVT